MNHTLFIRPAEVRDQFNLAVLKQQVWIDTYAEEGIHEEFSRYVLSAFTPAAVEETLMNPSIQVLVAECNGHLLGCAELNFRPEEVSTSVKGPEIAVLYVLERFTGQGIGKMLLDRCTQLCREQGHRSLWLTVYYLNHRALQFYRKHHFKEVGITYFEMDDNRYENKIMALELDREENS